MLVLIAAATMMGLPINSDVLVPVPQEQADRYFDCLAKASPSAATRYVKAEASSAAAERALKKLDLAIPRCMESLGFQSMKGTGPEWYRENLATALQRIDPAAPPTP